MKRIGIVFLMIVLLSGGWTPAPAPVQAEPAAPADDPSALVASGVSDYTLAAPKLFWHTSVPICPPADPAAGLAPLAQIPEIISRIATYGGATRELYHVLRNCGAGQILSNLVADATDIYWLGATGLMHLSTNANVGDAPQLVNSLVSGSGYVALTSDRIYTLIPDGVDTRLNYVLKSNHQTVNLGYVDPSAKDVQTDGSYLYYRVGTTLYRVDPSEGIAQIATGVTGYYPEGKRLTYCTVNPFHCNYTNHVYVAKGRSIYIYDNDTNSLASSPTYTSIDVTASIYGLVSDFGHLFFFESRQATCPSPPCFIPYITVLMRTSLDGTDPAALYTYGPVITRESLQNLTSDGTFVFWGDNGQIKRLPGDATALPQVNLKTTGMEVTQGIQDLSNNVLLIKNRRTFVRLYVSAASPVSGVTAYLYNESIVGGQVLAPVNPAGTKLTVNTAPNPNGINRNDINQSFLFELPVSWTQGSLLTLRAVLNPNKVPLEPDYSDNGWLITVAFSNSPSLSVEFFRLNYTLGGITYSPRIAEDILRTYSWILRAYPLAGGVGENFKPRLWDVDGGAKLANWVNATDPACAQVYPNPDERNLCASHFANGWLYYYRTATQYGALNVGLNTNAFYYGMISDAAGFFPRGQAMYTKTSVGPSGAPGPGDWDTDGTYADWYAAHEIGHSLGRAHPNAGSDDPATSKVFENCGHSRSDSSYPYGNTTTARTPIGPADNTMEGFDRGDAGLGIPKAVLPSSIWNDVMSYCSNQWISNYTYTGIYNYLLAHPSDVAPADVQGGGGYVGDYLIVAGEINPATPTASFSFIRRVTNVTDLPVVSRSEYSLRLLDATNGVLDTELILAQSDQITGRRNFGHVIAFAPHTARVQVIRNSDGKVLVTQAVSANSPVVSNVALPGAPNPVTGVVTLTWNASDADGDPLTFDVAYSRDNGVTFQPVTINLSQTNANIDTAKLGGSGTAIIRVTASDGVNSGFANSAPFVMANRPPQPFILTPENNLHVHYGQLVSFSGMALDAQDGSVTGGGLVWKDGKANVLGTGTQVSLDNLPVGTNQITLFATNSVGLTASASVTVIVDDDLNLPGATLTVGPAQVGWQAPAGSVQLLTATVTIGNAGSGDLAWTAAENAGWLALSATNGTVKAGDNPFALTLTANPTGLNAGKTYSTQLIVTKPASGSIPEQKISIPVSLSVGVIHDVFFSRIFVPILRR